MVVLQPACANQSPWTTTNSAYGEFYVSVHREIRKSPEPVGHKECSKKAEALGKELSDVKSKLECMRRRCTREPCPKAGFILPPGSDLNPNLFSPKIGKCECPTGPGPLNPDPYISVCKNEYNGAKLHDPQFLEGHIKSHHPRLVKRVSPPKPYSAPRVTGNGSHFTEDSDLESRSGYKFGSDRPRQCKMIGLYKRTRQDCPPTCGSQEKSNYNSMRVKVFENSGNNSMANTPDLSARLQNDQRYNFYKYYENCPSGFSLGDIFYNDNEGSYFNPMHGDFLNEIFPHIDSCLPPIKNSLVACNKHVTRNIEYPTLDANCIGEDNKSNGFDFCCYGKLSQGETIKFSASKESECLESNKSSIPQYNVSKENSNSINLKETQTLASSLSGSDEPIQNLNIMNTLDNIKKRKHEPTSLGKKDLTNDIKNPISFDNENNKFDENIVESNDVKFDIGNKNKNNNSFEESNNAKYYIGDTNKIKLDENMLEPNNAIGFRGDANENKLDKNIIESKNAKNTIGNINENKFDENIEESNNAKNIINDTNKNKINKKLEESNNAKYYIGDTKKNKLDENMLELQNAIGFRGDANENKFDKNTIESKNAKNTIGNINKNKLDEKVVEANNAQGFLGSFNEIKYKTISTNGAKVDTKSEITSKPKVFYEFDVFFSPNNDLVNHSHSDLSNHDSVNSVSSSTNEIDQNNECTNVDCNLGNFQTLWKPQLCYELEISPREDGRKLGSFDVNLEDDKDVDKDIKFIETRNKKSEVLLSTSKESRELCFEVNFNSKAQIDKNSSNNTKEKSKYQQNIDIEEINNENIIHIDSLSNSNMSDFSQHSIDESKSIDYQLNNDDEQSITPFLDVGLNSLDNQLDNQVQSPNSSPKNFTFDPKVPLLFNLYVNYDGHCVGQLKMQTKIDKQN